MVITRPTTKTHGRCRTILWWLLIAQCLASAVLIALTIMITHMFKNIGLVGTPEKSIYNITISFLTFIFLVTTFFLNAYGWDDGYRHGCWNSTWSNILVNLILLICWIIACYTSFLQCPDLCSQAPYLPSVEFFSIVWAGTCCNCYFNDPQQVSCPSIDTSGLTVSWWGVGTPPVIKLFTFPLMLSFAAVVILHIIARWGDKIGNAFGMTPPWQIHEPRPVGDDAYALHKPAESEVID